MYSTIFMYQYVKSRIGVFLEILVNCTDFPWISSVASGILTTDSIRKETLENALLSQDKEKEFLRILACLGNGILLQYKLSLILYMYVCFINKYKSKVIEKQRSYIFKFSNFKLTTLTSNLKRHFKTNCHFRVINREFLTFTHLTQK